MRTVELTLKAYLKAHGLSAYRLYQAADGRVSRNTVYALARGDVSRVDLGTLGAVISTLEELTGQAVNPADLLAVVPEADAESHTWLAADASRLGEFEPYDWGGLDPSSLGEAVTLGADGQLVIGGE